ncbi:conserved hypothetical protein [Prevotella intermedia]|uniref:Uncharacterized protein n=1 Tax=Prevotella intermedia TaxID=28131 RepID=A0A0S3ULC8_PREIN|nr:conserved hypothetical protein [Prevotella intermedia]
MLICQWTRRRLNWKRWIIRNRCSSLPDMAGP